MTTIREEQLQRLASALKEQMSVLKQDLSDSQLRQALAVVVRAWDNCTDAEAEVAYRRVGIRR